MPLYNVHIYREMRLFFPGIEAGTPEDAAKCAADKPTPEAAYTADCDGETLAPLVDVVGDDEFEQSQSIDFEAERLRKAAGQLMEALQEALAEIEYFHGDMLSEEERRHPRGSGWARVHDKGMIAIAAAKGLAR